MAMPENYVRNYVCDVTREETWDILKTDKSAVLIDCRTGAEWFYVGRTDLSGLGKEQLGIAWKNFPSLEINPAFAEEIASACPDKQTKLLIMCRSEVRSIDAAIAATAAGYAQAYNILEGFVGDKDAGGHRGNTGGWKYRGLPWKQE